MKTFEQMYNNEGKQSKNLINYECRERGQSSSAMCKELKQVTQNGNGTETKRRDLWERSRTQGKTK
jgi:hypothetical protein